MENTCKCQIDKDCVEHDGKPVAYDCRFCAFTSTDPEAARRHIEASKHAGFEAVYKSGRRERQE